LACDFGPAVPLQKTQHEGRPVLVWQALNLVIENGLDFTPAPVGGVPGRRQHPSFVGPPAGGAPFGVRGNSMCDSMKPGGQRVALADRAGPPGQNQKSGLKSILGVLLVLQYMPAYTQDERTVPIDKDGEGRLVASPLKLLQQLLIGAFFLSRQGDQPPDTVNDPSKHGFGHGINSASD
jgi:hypothetical protein